MKRRRVTPKQEALEWIKKDVDPDGFMVIVMVTKVSAILCKILFILSTLFIRLNRPVLLWEHLRQAGSLHNNVRSLSFHPILIKHGENVCGHNIKLCEISQALWHVCLTKCPTENITKKLYLDLLLLYINKTKDLILLGRFILYYWNVICPNIKCL